MKIQIFIQNNYCNGFTCVFLSKIKAKIRKKNMTQDKMDSIQN